MFPQWLTLGGGLIGGLEWHFAAMWFLVANGAIYITYGLLSGRFRRKLLPLWPSDVIRDLRLALAGKIDHHDITVYNSVQRLLYIGVICLGVLAVVSGIAIWKPVQFRPLVMLLGDFDTARLIHFITMSAIVGFVRHPCRDGRAGATHNSSHGSGPLIPLHSKFAAPDDWRVPWHRRLIPTRFRF